MTPISSTGILFFFNVFSIFYSSVSFFPKIQTQIQLLLIQLKHPFTLATKPFDFTTFSSFFLFSIVLISSCSLTSIVTCCNSISYIPFSFSFSLSSFSLSNLSFSSLSLSSFSFWSLSF